MLIWSDIRFRYVLLSATIGLFGASVWLTSCRTSIEKPAELIAVEATLPEKVDYNLHVKPILSDRCFACHGPDKAKQQAGLRLDTPEGAYEALQKTGHTAIVPGNLAKSELAHRILSTDPEEMMPTPKSNLSLTTEEKALLLRWIEQGAEYKEHWSLIAPTMPEIPQVKDQQWAKNDIDRFILAKQEAKKLGHAPEADKTTLLRRVSLDLIGLPPTPAEIDAFLADKSPNAYEKVVNRLLNNPHYGERQAVEWLDVAHYADTHGYQDDGLRTMWPYRDWVIRAYNRNLSFDRFITWQLAGDLLPNPNRDQLIATAFNRNHQQSQEGGIVDEEYRVEYVADRTNTFGKAMLGLTVECARCHDHKYDPISQKDYYSLFAFFNSNNDRGQIPYNGEAAPTITLTKPETDAKIKFIRERLTPLEQQLNPNPPDYQKRFGQWLGQAAKRPLSSIDSGLIAHYTFDEADRTDISAFVKADREKRKLEDEKRKKEEEARAKSKKPAEKQPEKKEPPKRKTKEELWKDPRNAFENSVDDTIPARLSGDPDKVPYTVPGRFGKARYFPGDSYIELPSKFGAFEQNEPFSISSWFNLAKPNMALTFLGRTTGPMDGQRGYQLDLLADGRLKLTLSHVWPSNAIDVETTEKVPVHQWFQVALTYDGMGQAQGVHLYLNGKPMHTKVVADHLIHSMVWGKDRTHWAQHSFYVGRMHDNFYKDFAVDELRIYNRCLTPLEIPRLAGQADALANALHTANRTPEQRSGLYNYYVTTQDPVYRNTFAQAMKLRGEQLMLYTNSDQVMVMEERKTPRETHLLKRGAYDAPGEVVTPAVLHSLNPLDDDLPKNRLGLAQWLLSDKNPLFSRVIVNRVWQQYFGQGLAKNSDDFGNQGALPSHPELLDYLAVRFRESGGPHGWNLKALHKEIVMSATYRQSSTVSEKDREADPDNLYLTRGASYRMSAEQVRDNALAVSGLLTQRIGGPSVHPYQPAGIWEALATRNAVKYVQNHKDSLYRRSMYTIWKRSSPPPMMLNFDAAERHTCIVKRQKTNTPLQALVTLNDPQFVEAARVLAQRIGQQDAGKQDERKVINDLFKAVISRPARAEEVTLMQQLYAEELADFKKNPKRAAELLSVGEYPIDTHQNPAELAAWTVVSSTVMNFDEAIIKR
ncbi:MULTISPECIES: DUF1553 domain-containing protein [unclassified Spirosoma]|uniref:DUF1553 domain-containing protein n=1 Tax=unclassified Spirosoma TaxID=2621999 RepID=UPI00096087F2|nr:MULTISPECIES: DUF1553 domain-containing protein [unclassified Spirosoma]MBN8824844.1 DUF1553 domain-containing protein [Spirosoma sp.]OJW77007.1 MAG: hypothetical protein BGO59_23430 [Spirosoma sp. 48-14]